MHSLESIALMNGLTTRDVEEMLLKRGVFCGDDETLWETARSMPASFADVEECRSRRRRNERLKRVKRWLLAATVVTIAGLIVYGIVVYSAA